MLEFLSGLALVYLIYLLIRWIYKVASKGTGTGLLR